MKVYSVGTCAEKRFDNAADQSYKWIPNLQGSPSSRQVMKNIYEVLRQKEADIERLKKELQALRVVAPLLEEELTPELQVAPPPVRTYPTPTAKPATVAMATDTKPIWP